METCDALVAGGGPAGSACAWKLHRAGLDVLVVDGATFPRDKVCAGWITPQVVGALQIDVDEYRAGRTFQAITGFRTGLIGGPREVETTYPAPVSFGIRRCEFDYYLLQRSKARLRLGSRIASIRREAGQWIVNESVSAPVLVGAGGHFCRVASMLNQRVDAAPLVVAQETEFPITPDAADSFATTAERPELFFSRDLKGYGWCFRKEGYLNIGFGRLDRDALPKATAEFMNFLKRARKIPVDANWRWHGHAYLVSTPPRRRVIDAGVLLVGDAAGLAYPQSGEGIRPAVESGLMAATAILDAGGRYTRDRLAAYERALRSRFGETPLSRVLSHAIPPSLMAPLAGWLFDRPSFVRHVLLDRWFLHAADPPLALS